MKVPARLLCVTAVVAALAAWSLSGSSRAADDKADVGKDIDKIAELFAKGDKDAAKKEAEAVAKKTEEIGEVMHQMGLRKKQALGVGPKPGAITPDGIEAKLTALGKRPLAANAMGKEAEALEQMGYRIAAIGQVAQAKLPGKDNNQWKGWAEDMTKSGLELAAAAKAKKAADLKAAATKVEGSCNACHEKFR